MLSQESVQGPSGPTDEAPSFPVFVSSRSFADDQETVHHSVSFHNPGAGLAKDWALVAGHERDSQPAVILAYPFWDSLCGHGLGDGITL